MILAAILLILWLAALLMLVCLCQIAGRADANLAPGPRAGTPDRTPLGQELALHAQPARPWASRS